MGATLLKIGIGQRCAINPDAQHRRIHTEHLTGDLRIRITASLKELRLLLRHRNPLPLSVTGQHHRQMRTARPTMRLQPLVTDLTHLFLRQTAGGLDYARHHRTLTEEPCRLILRTQT